MKNENMNTLLFVKMLDNDRKEELRKIEEEQDYNMRKAYLKAKRRLISKVPIEVIGYDNYESKNNKAQVFKISSEVKRILSKSEVGNLNFNIGNFSFENVPFHR